MFRYYLFLIGKFLVLNFPRWFVYGLARVISELHYYLHFVDRKNVKRNIQRITQSNKQVAALSHAMFLNFGRYLVEFFRMNKMVDQDFLKNNVHVENLNYIEDVLNRGQGGIVLTAHIGNWELGGLMLSELGFPLTVIALPHNNHAVNDFFNQQREEKHGITVVPTNIAVRKCIHHLKSNRLVAVVGDRDFFNNGEVLPFLGEKAIMPKGAAMFSLKTGAPIIPVFLIREGLEKYILRIEKPFYPPPSPQKHEEKKEAIKSLINQYIPTIEGIIKEHPEQWLMFRDFAVAPDEKS